MNTYTSGITHTTSSNNHNGNSHGVPLSTEEDLHLEVHYFASDVDENDGSDWIYNNHEEYMDMKRLQRIRRVTLCALAFVVVACFAALAYVHGPRTVAYLLIR